MKQLHEAYEQIEQNTLALSTFKFLENQEDAAIPRRLEVCTQIYLIHHVSNFHT